MGEIVHLHVGQAGVQIANACWELYCLEHGIHRDGCLCECPSDNSYKNFFAVKDSNKLVPRAVLVDSEPTVIDQVRTGPFGRLFSPHSLITGKEDSGSSFARGYFTIAPELIDVTMEAIRYAAECSSSLQGFMTFRSIGGGTGSGFGNALAERIQDEYDKVSKLEFVIFPSPSMSPLIVEPYNAVLATHLGMDTNHCSFVLDNEALYDICESRLNVSAPKYANLNRIIGQAASTFTTSQRFGGTSNMTFLEIETNLVPYPRIHFPLVSFAPFIATNDACHTILTTEQMTNACFEPSCQLVRCNPTEGKYMACVLLYRGSILMADINHSLSQLRAKDTVQFVDWSPTGFKVGLNKQIPYSIPCGDVGFSNKTLVALSNNTVISDTWCRVIQKYEHLFSRRAFIHHFIEEGLEEDSLKEASEDIYALISDYREVDKAQPPTDSRQHSARLQLSKKKSDLSTRSSRPSRKQRSDEGKQKYSDQSELSKKPRDSSEISLPQLPGVQSKITPRNSRSKSPSRRPPSEAGESFDEIAMPQLPGFQSLNYFFCESKAAKDGKFVLDCEATEKKNAPSMSATFKSESRSQPRSGHEANVVHGKYVKQKTSHAVTLNANPSKRLGFEQGLETEACRARDRFCCMPKPRNPCCEMSPFCLSSCENQEPQPTRYYQIAPNDPCVTAKPCKCPNPCNCPNICMCISPCKCPNPCKCPTPCNCPNRCNCPNPCKCPTPCNCPNRCMCISPCKCPNPCKCPTPCNCPNRCTCPNPCKCPNPCTCPNPCKCPNPCTCPNPCKCPNPCTCPNRCKCPKLCEVDTCCELCPCNDCENEPIDVCCELDPCLRICCSKCSMRKKCDPNCFCCTGNDDDIFANDDRVVTCCCRPPCLKACKCICKCCPDHVFDVAGTRCPCNCLHPICCKDEEPCCPCEERICECCPETSSLASVMIRQSYGDDNGKTVCVKFEKKK